MLTLLIWCNEYRAFYLDFAEQLLKCFVKHASNFYGQRFTVYSVHALLHMWWCKKCQLLTEWHISIRIRKIHEKFKGNGEKIGSKKIFRNWKCWKPERNWSICCFAIETKRFLFSVSRWKMCFLKHKISEDSYECDTFKFAQIESLYVTPIDSIRLGIVFLGNMNTVGFAVVEI